MGDWNLTKINAEGIEYNSADFGIQAVLSVNDDGTVLFDQMGEVTKGTWEATENGYLFDLEGEATVNINDGILVATYADGSNDGSLKFEKMESEFPLPDPEILKGINLETLSQEELKSAYEELRSYYITLYDQYIAQQRGTTKPDEANASNINRDLPEGN